MGARPAASSGLTIQGEVSAVRVLLGSDRVSRNAPLIVGSAPSGMDAQTASICFDPALRPTIQWAHRANSGAWLVLVNPSGSVHRPTLIIQNNHSQFYRGRYSTWAGSDKVWLDWWFTTLFVAIDLLDRTCGAEDLVIWHPICSSNPWGRQMYGVLLEVLMHMTDHRDLTFKRIALGCTHGLSYRELAFAAAQLRNEDSMNFHLSLQ